ncbi:MAG: class II aldolase/adducin family protein, partial [Acutalibacteraceae bacterium]|nr:class II aldolase/adducin family protein [Acutalibacteraceae bacterium]
MKMKYMEIREQICDVCHKMWQLGWVAANDGNVSVRLPDGNFMATPTGISKSFITPEKLVIIDKDMNVISAEGNYKP